MCAEKTYLERRIENTIMSLVCISQQETIGAKSITSFYLTEQKEKKVILLNWNLTLINSSFHVLEINCESCYIIVGTLCLIKISVFPLSLFHSIGCI